MNISITPLFAFGFGNLAMLGWLAAAAAPLLIHLWSRRRHREVPWAAVAFLLAAIRKNSRRIRLEQWLLLAVRTLIILLVVLAVAEPYGSEFAGGIASQPTHRVLVIDASLSMACREGDVSRLDRAKQLAIDVVNESGAGDTFSVVAMADPPRVLVSRDASRGDAIVGEIEAIAQTDGGGDLSRTLELVTEALQDDIEERRNVDRHSVSFFTDLQQATWLPNTSDPDQLWARFAKLADEASWMLVDVGSPLVPNLAVTDVGVREPFPTLGRELTFEATLRQFADEPRSDCIVELLIDDNPVGSQTVDLPADSAAVVHFSHRFRDAGEHTVEVRAASDRLDADNSRWLVVDVVERVDVLIVAGRRDDARYLVDALDPDPNIPSAIRPRVISEGEFADTGLEPFACVFLSNVAQLTAGEADRLARYVEQGRGLIVFLGDRVVADSYNSVSAADGAALLPARIGELLRETQFGLDPLDYRHAIVAPFRGRERAGLLTTPVARYYRLEMPTGQAQAEVALATPQGDPLIVTAPRGNGQVVLVATAGSLASIDAASGEPWTAWPAWPSFLPVVREILAYAAAGETPNSFTVGTPLAGLVEPGERSDSLTLTRPDGRTAELAVTNSATGNDWTYDDTDLGGVYVARSSSTGDAQFYAVNVDTAESDLTQVDRQLLPPELLVRSDAGAYLGQSDSIVPHANWHRPLLWTAFGMVLVELGLAWIFGRGGR
jgi:hypothetical protein